MFMQLYLLSTRFHVLLRPHLSRAGKSKVGFYLPWALALEVFDLASD